MGSRNGDNAEHSAEHQPTIYHARAVITMTRERAQAFAVLGERVVAIGAANDLRAQFAGAQEIDFGDAVVVPGFNDAHMHLGMTAEDLLHVDLSHKSTVSLSAAKAKLAEQARRVAPGSWIRASRYDDARMPEGRVLDRWDLDEVSAAHPILVIHIAGHWGVANSKALELGGIDEKTEPPFGGKFGRDATGRLNGVLYEQALFDFAYPSASKRGSTAAPASSFEERLAGLSRAVQMFHSAGLTSLGDALVGPDEIALFQEALRRGLLTLRVNMLVTHAHYEHVRRLGLRSGFGDDRLRFGGVKTFIDGAIGGRTCLMEQPFEGTTDDYGIQTMSTSDLRDIVRMVHGDGTRLCTHANGDRAISLLLGELEAAQAEQPRPNLAHRIEHCTIINEEILKRMKRLGAIAVPFGSYVFYHGGKLIDWYGRKRVERMFAHRSFFETGVAVAGSSDYPCGPYEPLLALQSCVTRRGSDGEIVGENQRLTPLQALALYTTNAAYAGGEDHFKGRLAPGFVADFVVLSDNPLEVEPATLGSLEVLRTYVGGKCVWINP
jgi:predicted amidohydrolase YtcJ